MYSSLEMITIICNYCNRLTKILLTSGGLQDGVKAINFNLTRYNLTKNNKVTNNDNNNKVYTLKIT